VRELTVELDTAAVTVAGGTPTATLGLFGLTGPAGPAGPDQPNTGYRQILAANGGNANWLGGNIVLNRSGTTVHAIVSNIKVAALGIFYLWPPGFAPFTYLQILGMREVVWTGNLVHTALSRTEGIGSRWWGAANDPTHAYSGAVSFVTPDAWPTTLPGTPITSAEDWEDA
jgi:hypothetical protein